MTSPVRSSSPAVSDPVVLCAQSVVCGYVRDLPIVKGVDLELRAGEIVVILGPNGAGKSTLVKALAGVVQVFDGTVLLKGEDITRAPPHRLSASGLGFVPQTANIFTSLTVEENLRMGGYLLRYGMRDRLDAAYAQFPDLAQRRRHAGHTLSGGQRQMLAIARALMTAPRVLLLDEPSAGLSPLMVSEVFTQVRKIADQGIAVLMVEQNVKAGLRIADRGLILVNGRTAHAGTAAMLRDDPVVAQLYLGKLAPAHAVAGNAAPSGDAA